MSQAPQLQQAVLAEFYESQLAAWTARDAPGATIIENDITVA